MTGWLIAIGVFLLFGLIKNWDALQRYVNELMWGNYFINKKIDEETDVNELLDMRGELGGKKRYKKRIDKRLKDLTKN